MRKLLCAAFVLVFSVPVLAAASADWPQFRGPNRDDVSTETGLLKEWPADGPKLVWTGTGIGSGYSTVSVVGGKIFTMGDKDGSSHVFALNEADGKIVWSTKVGKPGGNYDGTRCTPTVNEGKVYALGQFADLVCLNAADGKEVWRHNIESEFGGKMMSGWNFSESPLVDGKLVICTPGGAKGTMLALDKSTGTTVWQSGDIKDAAAYSSVVPCDLGGVHQYVQLTAAHVFGVDAASGKVLWSADREGRTAVIPTPIVYQDMVFVTSGYGVGCNCFKVVKEGDKWNVSQLYANKGMTDHHGGALRIGEYIYGHSDGNGWVCIEMKTGKVMWTNPGVGKGSVTFADGMLYCRSEGGGGGGRRPGPGGGGPKPPAAGGTPIALVEASPEAYKEHGRFMQPNRSGKNSWPHPVVANGKLYIRDQDNLMCYDVKGK